MRTGLLPLALIAWAGAVGAAAAPPPLGRLAEDPFPAGPDRLGPWFRDHPDLRDLPGSGWKPYNRFLTLLAPRATVRGENTALLRQRAWESSRERFQAAGASAAAAWFSTGPTDLSGRAVDLAFDPTDPAVVYVATAGGGLWKTTDGGDTWLPLTDFLATTTCGAVAVLPWDSQVVLLGTGEGVLPGFFDLSSPFGVGMLRSTDAGTTWSATSLSVAAGTPSGFHVIETDSASQAVLAGASNGLWRSTDDGATWSQVESGNNVFDVKWKPGDSATVYVTKGPDPFINTGADAGVKISTDGGLTFQTAGTGQPPAASVGKARLGVTPADPSVVYVNYADSNTFQSLGVYRSTDAGATWQPRNTTLGMMGSQGWYNLVLTVDRQDPDLLLTGGVGLYRSTDGGATFSQLSGQGVAPPFGDATRPHVDNHALAYEPGSDDAVWVCTDGGPWRSTDDGVTWQSRREGIVSYQFYDVCVAQTPTNFMVGGTQDNGIPRRKAGTWQETTLTTDGMVCNVDPLAPGTVYGESQNGNHRVSPNQGFSWSPINTGITGTGPWITAQDHDPTAQGRLFTTSSTGIFRTDSAGSLWTNVAPHTARWISISPANPDIVWTVSNFFGVWHTTDDGATWTQSVTFPATGGTEQKIHADPHDPAAAYVVFGSYTPGVTRIVRTRDLGATWEDVTGDFPDVPANTFVADPDRMNEWYVGSDLGIWLSTDEGQQWNPVGTGFPNCAVSDLEIKRPKRKLVAATYGRGVWEYDLPSTAVGAPEIAPVATRTLMLDPPFPNPAFRSTLLRFASRGEGEASLELFDVAGRRVSRIARIPRGDGVVRQLEWRPDDVSAGVYFVVLRAGDRRISRKLVVTR